MTAQATQPETATKRIYIETFGCQMNVLDTELALGQLKQLGYTPTDERLQADLILYNTCSVREHAEHKVWSRLGKVKQQKRTNPDLIVGVLGCMAQEWQEEILKKAPQVDLVLGTREIGDLGRVVDRIERDRLPIVQGDLTKPVDIRRDITVRDKKYSAYVTVMYGCDFSCTYCIVPYTRGVEQSRPIAELKDEVERLCADGVKEITFLGQTVDSYGKRLPGRPNLGDLMEAVHDTAGLERIRFITSHPQLMRDPILRRMGELPKVCEYLHIPAQSGSNRQLKAMNRGYTVERYREICDRARELVPDLSIASDFIVGFPGETDEDFEQTLRLVEEQEFGQAYIFKYSPRPHTPAWDMEDDVPEVLKKERNQRLLRAQEAVQLRLNRSRIGRTERVLCEGTSRGRSENLAGRNRQNRIVCFQGDAEKLVGQIVEVEITDASSFALYGCLPGQPPLFAQPKVEEAVYVPPTAGALVGAPPQGAPSKKLRPLPMLSEPSESDCH